MFSKATPRREPVLRSSEPVLRYADHAQRQTEPPLRDVLVTTTPGVEGRPVTDYLGLVTGQSLVAAGALREPAKGLRGLFRKGAANDEDPLSDAREEALKDMRTRASAKGADAVLGVSLGHQVLGELLLVTATGTAVRLG